MAHIIHLKEILDNRGSLLPVNTNDIPFSIKRVFFIYGVESADIKRGGHRHKKSVQALISITGSCVIKNNNGIEKNEFLLDTPSKVLILEPQDWHTMEHFSKDCVLAVLASTEYDVSDYIDTPYDN